MIFSHFNSLRAFLDALMIANYGSPYTPLIKLTNLNKASNWCVQGDTVITVEDSEDYDGCQE